MGKHRCIYINNNLAHCEHWARKEGWTRISMGVWIDQSGNEIYHVENKSAILGQSRDTIYYLGAGWQEVLGRDGLTLLRAKFDQKEPMFLP